MKTYEKDKHHNFMTIHANRRNTNFTARNQVDAKFQLKKF